MTNKSFRTSGLRQTTSPGIVAGDVVTSEPLTIEGRSISPDDGKSGKESIAGGFFDNIVEEFSKLSPAMKVVVALVAFRILFR